MINHAAAQLANEIASAQVVGPNVGQVECAQLRNIVDLLTEHICLSDLFDSGKSLLTFRH